VALSRLGVRRIDRSRGRPMSLEKCLASRNSSCLSPSVCSEGGPMLSKAPIRAYIPASDVGRARKFYEELVGLRPKEEYAGGVIYDCAGTEVFLYPTANAGTSKASQAYWQVDDVESEVAQLKARGVKFEEYDMPGLTTSNSIAAGGGAKAA